MNKTPRPVSKAAASCAKRPVRPRVKSSFEIKCCSSHRSTPVLASSGTEGGQLGLPSPLSGGFNNSGFLIVFLIQTYFPRYVIGNFRAKGYQCTARLAGSIFLYLNSSQTWPDPDTKSAENCGIFSTVPGRT